MPRPDYPSFLPRNSNGELIATLSYLALPNRKIVTSFDSQGDLIGGPIVFYFAREYLSFLWRIFRNGGWLNINFILRRSRNKLHF